MARRSYGQARRDRNAAAAAERKPGELNQTLGKLLDSALLTMPGGDIGVPTSGEAWFSGLNSDIKNANDRYNDVLGAVTSADKYREIYGPRNSQGLDVRGSVLVPDILKEDQTRKDLQALGEKALGYNNSYYGFGPRMQYIAFINDVKKQLESDLNSQGALAEQQLTFDLARSGGGAGSAGELAPIILQGGRNGANESIDAYLADLRNQLASQLETSYLSGLNNLGDSKASIYSVKPSEQGFSAPLERADLSFAEDVVNNAKANVKAIVKERTANQPTTIGDYFSDIAGAAATERAPRGIKRGRPGAFSGALYSPSGLDPRQQSAGLNTARVESGGSFRGKVR